MYSICYFKCQFCAFSKGKLSENLRGRPYDLGLDEIAGRVREAWERGATEVCMQGGIHPSYTGATYLSICRAVKKAAPGIHVHAFSPLEVLQGAKTLGVSIVDFLAELKGAGLGTLPGTAAEILDDEVRAVLCPDKINTAQWLEVMGTTHRAGLRSTATVMFGHIDRYDHWARHIMRIRETVLMHAVARLSLHERIANVQVSWVKLGKAGIRACLKAGVNDLGGTLMDETISRSAGASHGHEMTPQAMEALILGAGRVPRLRTTLYTDASSERRSAAFCAAARRKEVFVEHSFG
ncbi:FO synthase [Afipia felis]|uniref:FO synthase n=2 Tax=Afipia felis TaxID=1035 RepID=A0A380WDN3_AFIFE|nr:radical SAM domain-containing protein, CofH subfamily [Afipia felis ATCC 53690]SUU78418.1 FO synthase [Afipia felis]SUU86483.1 FO synthase [Afipia felis]